MQNPLVSICVITYNSSLYVKQTLDSILQQDYNNYEIIISDDVSTDNTLSICEQWIKDNNNRIGIENQSKKIKCILTQTKNNIGICGNYNNALKYCNGEFIKYIAGDDILKPNCISSFVKEIEINVDIYCCLRQEFFNDGKIGKIIIEKELQEKDQLKAIVNSKTPFRVLCGATLFIRKNYLNKKNGFNENYPMVEDYPLCMEYLLSGKKIKQIEKPLINYRVYNQSVSLSHPNFWNMVEDASFYYLPMAALKCRMYLLYIDLNLRKVSRKYNNKFSKCIFKYLSPLHYINWIKFKLGFLSH